LYLQPTYKSLLAVVVVGNVTPMALKTAFHVKALAVPSSLNLKTKSWHCTGVPVGAAIVVAAAIAVKTPSLCWSAFIVNVAEFAASCTLGLTIPVIFAAFMFGVALIF
jgi:hypothetical protein